MKLHYYVYHPGELMAGIIGYNDEITINVPYADPNDKELVEHFRESLKQWFDGARVETQSEFDKRVAAETGWAE